MRLLYFSVIERHSGWGAEYFLNKALVARGVQTRTLDYRNSRLRLSRALLSEGGRYDGMLVQRGDDFPVEIVRSFPGPKIFLFSELVERCSDADHLFRSDLFDLYLVRGPRCKRVLASRGYPDPRKVEVFLSSFDPHVFARREQPKDLDCVFVGSVTERRRRLLADLAEDLPVKFFSAFGEEANRVFNRSKIVLNLHAEDYLDTETRIYEVLGSGAFLVSERLSEENPFISGKDFVQVDSPSDLKSTIRHFLSHDDERELIARNGYREAHARHTYDARAGLVVEQFQKLRQGSSGSGFSLDRKKLARYAGVEWSLRARARPGELIRRAKGFLKRLLYRRAPQ
jgi:hypothetical protein